MDDKTVFKRGKSLIPASRMEIEESRRVREERREVTDALREARDWVVVILLCMERCRIVVQLRLSEFVGNSSLWCCRVKGKSIFGLYSGRDFLGLNDSYT